MTIHKVASLCSRRCQINSESLGDKRFLLEFWTHKLPGNEDAVGVQ